MMHGTVKPRIAIITPSILTGLGLQTIIEKIIPTIDVVVFDTFAEFAATDTTQYVHFFTATQLFLRHNAFFRALGQKTILLGSSHEDHPSGLRQIDIFSGEQRLVHDILQLRNSAPRPDHALPRRSTQSPELLSARENEVLTLIAHGLLNKQIADQLSIGLTTVISHRRKIMEKLGVKSVAGLVIYAVSMGFADADEV